MSASATKRIKISSPSFLRSNSRSIRFDDFDWKKTKKRSLLLETMCIIMSSHLEVKRAVHAVLLRPEDARQVFRHDEMMRDEFGGGKCGQNLDLNKKGRKNTRVKRKHA